MAIVGDEREKYRLLNNGLSAFATESGSDVHLQMARNINRYSNFNYLLDFQKRNYQRSCKNGIKG